MRTKRLKRLQHEADTLCHMFCGWRLIGSYGRMEQLGSGRLTIDALTQACTFNGQSIATLGIAIELTLWLRDDLAANRIDSQLVREATLEADLELTNSDRESRLTTSQHYTAEERHYSPERFVRLGIHCTSRVVTHDLTYVSDYRDLEEWPEGWASG